MCFSVMYLDGNNVCGVFFVVSIHTNQAQKYACTQIPELNQPRSSGHVYI